MTHELNVGTNHTVLNGYQNYLKRTQYVMKDEVECSRALGYNLGIKLIRGAYMVEERDLAAASGVESPIWDTLEETHANYNGNMQHIIDNMNENDLMLCGSHNVDSVKLIQESLAKNNIEDHRVRFG
jgi:proline dehydrogenase